MCNGEGVVGLYVDVPCTSFRMAHAREFLETYLCPPPSTVYGMLLSLVGENERCEHEGAEIAIALLSEPFVSEVLRKVWRVKDRSQQPGSRQNVRPDYQQIMTGLRLAVWVRRGVCEVAPTSLAERVRAAVLNPGPVLRSGGLSLGESSHLVNDLRFLREEDMGCGQILEGDPMGEHALPIWADHVCGRSVWGQFKLAEGRVGFAPTKKMWVVVDRKGIGT